MSLKSNAKLVGTWWRIMCIGLMPALCVIFLYGCNDRAMTTPTSESNAPESNAQGEPAEGKVATRPTAQQEQQEAQPETQPSAATQPVDWEPPEPPGARMHANLRHRMVETQLASPRDRRRPIRDPDVLEAMRAAPRHVFAPGHSPIAAYRDSPLPIGHDQTISQPYIVALMTELLDVTSESRVLEIGTGSGYQAAVLAHLTPHVYTIEIVEPLARQAIEVLEEQGYTHVHCRIGDGYKGWEEAAPFDGIIVTCAADDVPEPLWEQLRVGGRMVIPLGPVGRLQELVVLTKLEDDQREIERVIPVRFVPMTGEVREQR